MMTKIFKTVFTSNVGCACAALAMGALVHAVMLPGTFKTLDDTASIIDNPRIKDAAQTGKILTSSFFGDGHYYRPLVSLSFMADYHLHGLRSFYFNLTNLGLHLAATAAVFFIVLLILKDRRVAFGSSLLFAVHPVQWEAVANIPGRAVLLCTFLTLSAFYAFLLARQPGRRRPAVPYVLSLVLFSAGLLAKESAAMFPVLLAAYLLLIERAPKAGGRFKPLRILWPYAVALVVYILMRAAVGVTGTYPWRTPGEWVLGTATFLRAALTYVRLYVLPVDLHFDRAQAMFLSFQDPGFWATLTVWVAVAAALWRWRRRLSPAVKFFGAWFAIELFPVAQVVTTIGVSPGYISAAEHFLYMPSVGMFVLMVLGAMAGARACRARPWCSAALPRLAFAGGILFLMAVTVTQNYTARSAVTMFAQSLARNPDNSRILFSMGLEMAARGKYEEAETYFRRALDKNPGHLLSRLALGRALVDGHKYIEAMAVMEPVRDPGRWGEMLQKNLDEAYVGAEQLYLEKIAADPDNAVLHYSLGTVYSRRGRMDEAMGAYKNAVAADPRHKGSLFNLAASYEALGETGWAVVYYERVVALDSLKDNLDAIAYRHLAVIYDRQGDAPKARRYERLADLLEGVE